MSHTPVDVKYNTLFNNSSDNGGEVHIQASFVGSQTNPPGDRYYDLVFTFTDSQNVETSQFLFYITEKNVADLIKQLSSLVAP
jgi:hypothetical protein